MTVGDTIGIDLNGLSDVSVRTAEGLGLRGGGVPSVVVLPKDVSPGWTVVAGEEATRAIEGRGWQWPESARLDTKGLSLRIPVSQLLAAMQEDREVKTPHGEEIRGTNLLGAALEALAGPGAKELDSRIVVAVPDNGTYSDEVQQSLLDAAASRSVRATLLWRPVAAVLALEKELQRFADKLDGQKIGVLSLMDEGLHVSCLDIEIASDASGASYIVPVRRQPGIAVPYIRSVLTLAERLAGSLLDGDPEGGWQVLWVRPDRYVFGVVDEEWDLDRLLLELGRKLALH